MIERLVRVFFIARKDMESYYSKPPLITWGLIMPAVLMLAVYMRSPGSYLSVAPGIVAMTLLFGNTSIGADVASVLSARLSLPLVGSCVQISEGKLISQICGGKIMAESELAETTTLITMIPGGYKAEDGQSGDAPEVSVFAAPELDALRVTLKGYIEPEAGDVDISKEAILVSVGRGIQTEDNIEVAEELAELLGGEICASRPIVDQGWLPTSRMVGKSGQTVKPKLYLALGISGAPEHVEGMSESEMIIAVNMDPNAPIFDIATYGVEFDLFDLIDPLLEQLEEVKG